MYAACGPITSYLAPDSVPAQKASDVAHVSRKEAIPCTRWSHRPSIYRMSAK